ncbi:hypothetical protein H2198_009745 [Neophaeococcomyces mojaviensis]|uniref:Uncharacterized protein n=1 Tax=Neophaeococcomyces mojaviensis TaxID=3383035 RepID=A0ACC2ZTP9_9EURO|nr:hypothetical protein H2198_009745 [Knufia sp. JES_112]
MLDPLTALSLASPVLEIVRFSNFLSSRVCDLRSIGVVNYVNDIKIQVHDVGRTLTRIARLITDGTSDDGANEEKQRLTALCSQCREVGKKVAEHLEDVIASLPSQHSGPVAEKTNESRAAVKVKVNYATIEEYLKELKHLLAITSSQITASLRQSTTERFETTSLKHDMLQSGLSTILRLLENGGADIKEADFAEDGPVQQCMDISIQSELDSLHHIATVPYSLALTNTLIRRRTILSLINFRQMSDRIDEVDIAYKKTLEWIFQDKEYRLAWSSFPDFLRSASDPPYWINGKAGSGKSTLLRFLIRHKKALEHLRTWSGTRLLETAHFFAWNLGTTLQRTQMGLLQSLIYQVLVRDERLIHQVFPDLWHAIDPSQPKKHEPLSFAEAKRAFRRLIDLSAAKRCFCFFVDGIDEFEEDHNHVADLILGFQAPNLKFVLSSRPVDVCLDKFAGCPQLRLQDLTASDIETYIDGRLSSYHVMLDLMHEEPEATLELVHEVKERASGVFLWVKLVVTSLLTGLRKGDGIADLKVRLRALPPDLSKLFASMLGKMDPRYQKQAATLFRLVRTASMLLDGQGMPTQFLALAHHDFRSVLNHKPIAFETKKIMHWCRILERQLVSRCCGLVEFSRSSYKPDWWRADLNKLEEEDQVLLASQVQFLHRTVAEYLYQDEVWDKVVCKSSTNSRFNPHENLAYAALHMMKVSPLADDISSMQAYHWAKVLVQGVREFERREQTPLEDLVDEMDLVLRYHASYLSHWSSKIELYPAKNTVISHLTVLQRPLSNLLSFAAFVGLGAYVDSKLEQHGLVLGTGNSAQKVMLQTLFSRSDDWIKIELIDRVDAVSFGNAAYRNFQLSTAVRRSLQQKLLLIEGAATDESAPTQALAVAKVRSVLAHHKISKTGVSSLWPA